MERRKREEKPSSKAKHSLDKVPRENALSIFGRHHIFVNYVHLMPTRDLIYL
jgi:hypothetical protein